MPEVKLKLIGLVSALKTSETLDYNALAIEFGETPATLKRWVAQIRKKQASGTVLDSINLDSIILDRITEELKEEVEEVEANLVEINPISGAIEVRKAKGVPTTGEKVKQIKEFRAGVEGLKLLSSELQGVAGQTLIRISDSLEADDLDPRDLQSLAAALTSIQNAFFNKPTTNVNVLKVDGSDGSSLLSMFKDRMKP